MAKVVHSARQLSHARAVQSGSTGPVRRASRKRASPSPKPALIARIARRSAQPLDIPIVGTIIDPRWGKLL
jgi:hypothetical protein